MLHGYKKSRYNIYDNLEFLGLNFYEQKHFCFGEGEGDADGDAGADYDFSLANPEAVAAIAAVEEASRQAEEKAGIRKTPEWLKEKTEKHLQKVRNVSS